MMMMIGLFGMILFGIAGFAQGVYVLVAHRTPPFFDKPTLILIGAAWAFCAIAWIGRLTHL